VRKREIGREVHTSVWKGRDRGQDKKGGNEWERERWYERENVE